MPSRSAANQNRPFRPTRGGRARSVRVIALDWGLVVVEDEGQQWSLRRDEIQAVRPAAEERPG